MAIAELSLDAEILIADNGSTDGSQQIARKHGARVVDIKVKGYGAALRGGMRAAKGEYIIFADADDSYDWSNIEPFVKELLNDCDLVMGCRLPNKSGTGGTIMAGAMPWLHRWLGNPILSFIGRLFFKLPLGDFHCGMRGIRKNIAEQLDFKTDGMEFATEMLIKASAYGVSICEKPITLYPDKRTRSPHLRTWRDGWRHLRLMLLSSPNWLFVIPGSIMLLFGLFFIGLLWSGPVAINETVLSYNSLLTAWLLFSVGYQCITFGIIAKVIAYSEGLIPVKGVTVNLIKRLQFEYGVIIGVITLFAGALMYSNVFLDWYHMDFGPLSPEKHIPKSISAIFIFSLGLQTVFNSFFIGLVGKNGKME